nr:tetratricopeptide repeat protein [Tellurirhabdus rosea]
MLTEPTLERGRLLYSQGRYHQALTAFRNVLTVDPGNPEAMLMLAYTLIQLEQPAEALDVANDLLRQWPDQAVVLDLKARAYLGLKQPKEALRSAQEAIHLDPSDADYWGTASLIHYQEKDFSDALHHAEQGLQLDPSQEVCLNIRNLCLAKLGRSDELPVSIEETLAEDPGSAFSHASAGWALLEKGDHRKAREHFAEALRLEPGMTWAEAGMLEALKAKNPLFRIFLKYYFWMANLKGQQQWAVIIGSFVGIRFLNSLDSSVLAIELAQVAVMLFVWLTWFADPLFNVLMLADAQGRHLLSDRKRAMYRYVAVLLPLSFVAALTGYLAESMNSFGMATLFLGGLMGLGLVLPLSAWIEADIYKNRSRLRLMLFIMSLTAVVALVLLIGGKGEGMILFNLFTVELILFMFFRNFLLIEKND